ncbi:GNAT family N-acetyltransferase [Algoriphagus lacus]|uniref:Aminoglycoside N(6')-acetyltransferase type 1 n=1 Tax=Algoriphagus lacus TaxID=2056311 RepID=A0A418PV76_9BACT|nr:aminoglycoside 6'-N-acetyltransferase [Algoriphagus lacus]RIW17403.1 GNAT family N-acetyltransferase [Algoriphagus lacus]
MNTQLTIEKLSSENLRELTELVVELWTDCRFQEEFEHYLGLINSENEACFLLKEHTEFVAFLHVSIRQDYVEGAETTPTAYLEGIFVKPNYRKKGLAKLLISEAENWARQKGLKQFASDTPLTNQASIDFHKKAGFREVEQVVCFIKNLD